MKKQILLITAIVLAAVGSAMAQCNVNSSICSSGSTAGPFNFNSPGPQVSSCLSWTGNKVGYIILNIATSGNLNLLINANTSTGYLDVALFRIPAGEDPCTAIQNWANQIGCNYASDKVGCNQFGTSFSCASSVAAPSVNAGDRIMIVAEDYNNVFSTFTLQVGAGGATVGPPSGTVNPVTATITTASANFQMSAANPGGTWSASCGTCITSAGVFSPAIAGNGTHTVNYTVGTAPCVGTGSTTVTVGPSNTAPVLSNSTISTAEDTDLILLDAIATANPNTFVDAEDDDPVMVRFEKLPTNGVITIPGAGPAVLNQEYSFAHFSDAYYKPNPDFNGTDTLLLNVSDGQLWANTAATIAINITPVNDAPVLEDLVITLLEDQTVAIADFGTPTTFTDVDGDDMVEFMLIHGPSHGALVLFGQPLLDGQTVAYADLGEIDYVPAPNYNGSDSFVWTASDGIVFADSAMAYITVQPVNDAPTDIAISNHTVAENSPAGTVVATFSTTDVDAGDSHYYQLVPNGASSAGNGQFTINGNQLVVANDINFEITPQLSINVQTVDLGGLSYEKSFVITVTDVNDAPTAVLLSNTVIDEQLPMGSLVGILSSLDEDANDSHTYTFVNGSGDADNASFEIVGSVLTTAAVLDFNAQPQHFIRIRSTDSHGAFTEETFVIDLNDANQAPTAIALSNASIAENNAIGAMVGFFTATDPDANDTHTYTLVSGAGDMDNTSFDILNGDLVATESFDFETKDLYSIRVRATDAGGLSTEEVFAITIIDGPDAPIGIAISNASIDENETIGTLVGTFSTLVVGHDTSHVYSLVAGLGSDDNGAFSLSGNVLTSSQPFNFEVKDSYTIRVRSIDMNGGSTEEVFAISINDKNDTPTDITLSVLGVDENSPIGTAVGFLNAVDEDVADTHTFTLVHGFGGSDNSKFSIDANKLQVNALLDYETQSSYTVRVRATDNAGAFVEKYFAININDVNEAPTAITLSATSINENEPAGSVIGTLATVDEDNADSHTYGFATGTGDDDNAAFHISGNLLVANASFNYEVKSSYTIRISSTDMGGLPMEEVFIITINDVLDAPVLADFSKTVFMNTPVPFYNREIASRYSQEEGRQLQYITIETLPSNGELLHYNTPVAAGEKILVAEIAKLTYNPMFGYLGADAFTLSAFDGELHSSIATYALNVIPKRAVGTNPSVLFNSNVIVLNPGASANREGEVTSIEEQMPIEVAAFGNYPNPFQGATNITFELPASMKVTLEVYDLLGRKVDTLVDGDELSGKQTIQWNGNEAGSYIGRLVATTADGQVVTKTISLLQVK